MLITTSFQKSVEVLADHHSRDWRLPRGLSAQDYFLIAQQQFRRTGIVAAKVHISQFLERVRSAAHRNHSQRHHRCDGPLVDWDRAWLEQLSQGAHLQEPLSWNERSQSRHCSVVYFVQARESRFDMAGLIYKLQQGLLHVACDYLPRGLLFQPLNKKEEDFEREVRYSNYQYPRIFVVDADELQRRYKLQEVLTFLHSYRIPWWCDADFISYTLRDATKYRNPYVPLNWNWANHAGWEWRDIACNLVCDMLAL